MICAHNERCSPGRCGFSALISPEMCSLTVYVLPDIEVRSTDAENMRGNKLALLTVISTLMLKR